VHVLHATWLAPDAGPAVWALGVDGRRITDELCPLYQAITLGAAQLAFGEVPESFMSSPASRPRSTRLGVSQVCRGIRNAPVNAWRVTSRGRRPS
jgi:hypothetical protein